MPDDPPLVRQWALLKKLSTRRYGLTVRDMAREMGVGEKTIRRDLDLFRSLGFPVEDEVGDFGRKTWKMTANWGQPPLNFAFDEALALYLGRRFLEPLAGTVFWQAAQSAFTKLHAMIGPSAVAYAERCQASFHQTTVGVGDYARKAELIDALMRGIEDQLAVHITYESREATEPATRDVYPYAFVYHRGSLYLVAFAPEHDAIRHYKVDRIEAVEVSTFPFRRPDDFDVSAHMAGSFGVFQGDGDVRVKVRFAPAVARYVAESRWHESQSLVRQRDGSVLAEFRLSGTEEIRSWVLGFGRNAAILEPESLRVEILEELRAMQAHYAADLESSPRSGTRSTRRGP